MHNQAVNSLGLLSARQTMAAVEVLSLIVANALYTACQGVDLRVLHRTFIASLKAPARKLIITGLFVDTQDPVRKDRFFTTFWKEFEEAWYAAAAYDAAERAAKAAQSLAVAVVNSQHIAIILPVEKVTGLTKAFESLILQSYLQYRDAFFKQPSTAQYLGQGTRMIYRFVREKLGVPLHRGLVEHPVVGDQEGNVIDGRPKKTIGSWVSIIYEAVRDGSLYAEVFQFLDASGGIANGVKVANGTKVSNGTNGECDLLN